MDLIPFLMKEMVSLDGERKTKMMRQLYKGAQLQIEEKKTGCLLPKQTKVINSWKTTCL
jgi:hypothetical protein